MPGGRPLKYKQPAKILKIGEQYFQDQDEAGKPYTITGLARALDISRSTLIDYSKKKEFSNTIGRLKQRVEEDYEESLRKRGNAGDIFGLKNFGWEDKRIQEVKDITEKTNEDLIKEIERIKKEALA